PPAPRPSGAVRGRQPAVHYAGADGPAAAGRRDARPARRHPGRRSEIPLATPALPRRCLMLRTLLTLLAVVVSVAGAGAQPPAEPEIAVRKLTVTPAAAPVPALKYKLLPDLRETTPGNAALLYYRAFSPE